MDAAPPREAAVITHGAWWLYDIKGQPIVFKRTTVRRKNGFGVYVRAPEVERVGNMRSKQVPAKVLRVLEAAWAEWITWNHENRQ